MNPGEPAIGACERYGGTIDGYIEPCVATPVGFTAVVNGILGCVVIAGVDV